MRVFAWGVFVCVVGVAAATATMARGRAVASHRFESDADRLYLTSPSGWQTVSKRDGGHTGLYYDVAEDLLKGRPNVSLVVLLGLGGGEMLRAAARAQPQARFVGVELDERTAAMAVTDFGLPPGTSVELGDALQWVKAHATTQSAAGSISVLMVDLFDDSHMVDGSMRWDFLSDCRTLIAQDGLFVMNVWPDTQAGTVEMALQALYPKVTRLHYGGNVILVGSKRFEARFDAR